MIKFLGVTDSVNTCDCCGKSGLKKTVELDFYGETMHYGTTCAGRALGNKTRTVEDVKEAVEKANKLERTKAKVDMLRRKTGQEWVYGLFYVNSRSIKSHTVVKVKDELLIHQIY